MNYHPYAFVCILDIFSMAEIEIIYARFHCLRLQNPVIIVQIHTYIRFYYVFIQHGGYYHENVRGPVTYSSYFFILRD